MRAQIYRDGKAIDTTSADEVRRAHEAGALVWVDLEARTEEVDALLTETFCLHPLTIEDVWSERAAPKIDDYEGYLYILVHAVAQNGHDAVSLLEVDIVLGPTFVLTHDSARCTTAQVMAEASRSSRVLAKGAPWIVHAVLDRLVDAYLPLIDGFDAMLDRLETDVMVKAGTREGKGILERLLGVKRSLQALRRITVHQREILLRLSRGEYDEIPPEIFPYMRDVYDHFVRVTDLAESYRELSTNVLEAYLSMQSNRMNEVMKTLTLISTVMLPLTFIAGVYGMNFDEIPELHWSIGYPFALALMAFVAMAIIGWFRRRGWF